VVTRLVLELSESFRIAAGSIRVHKMRAVLTTLGIVIGIASVTSMVTIINGIERQFDQSMSELGTDVLYVEKWPWLMGPGSRWWEYINRPDITADLAAVIESRARYATAAAPVVASMRSVVSGSVTLSRVLIEASTPAYERVHAIDLEGGRFYGDMDERGARHVAVLGARIGDELFPNEQPLGKFIRVGGHRFEVIGLMERRGSAAEGGQGVDSQIKIPFSTFRKLFGTERRSVSIQVKAVSPELIDVAQDELTGILRTARRVDAMDRDNFEINQQGTLRAQLAPIKLAIYGIGIFLTALALLVGGIGVMNIMYVSVKERTREIGLRKAVGARRRSILVQFLVEAVIVCLIGGVVGVGLSAILALLINLVISTYLPMSTVMLAFAICVGVGIIFGLAPAWAAARSEPIESLRYE
jgi:putative ABC transport system permease protein